MAGVAGREPITKHGRDHRVGGSDEIPGLSSGGAGDGAQSRYHNFGLDMKDIISNGKWHGASNWDFVTVTASDPGSTATTTAAAAPYGGYLELVGQNSYLCLGFPLAPRYSVWRFSPIFSSGPDCGIVTAEWQTVTAELGPGANGYDSFYSPAAFPQWGNEPTNFTSDTDWWAASSAPRGYKTFDTYAASAAIADTEGGQLQPDMYLNGDAGTLISANPTTFIYSAAVEWPGGADGSTWWWVRLKTKTKNASSSAYTMRFHGYSMYRLAGGHVLTPN